MALATFLERFPLHPPPPFPGGQEESCLRGWTDGIHPSSVWWQRTLLFPDPRVLLEHQGRRRGAEFVSVYRERNACDGVDVGDAVYERFFQPWILMGCGLAGINTAMTKALTPEIGGGRANAQKGSVAAAPRVGGANPGGPPQGGRGFQRWRG